MEIRIGIVNSPRELSFETDGTVEEINALVEQAFSQSSGVLRISSNKDKDYLIPSANIAYLELGTEAVRRVGFVG